MDLGERDAEARADEIEDVHHGEATARSPHRGGGR